MGIVFYVGGVWYVWGGGGLLDEWWDGLFVVCCGGGYWRLWLCV